LFCFGFGFGLELLSSLVMEDFLRLRQARHINYSFRFWFASAAGYQKALQEKGAPKKPEKSSEPLVIYKHARRFG